MEQLFFQNAVCTVVCAALVSLPASLHTMAATKDRFTGYKSSYEAKLKQAQDFSVPGAAGVTQQQLQNFHKALTEARDALSTIEVEAKKIERSSFIATIRNAPLSITTEYFDQQRKLLDNLQTRYNAEYEELKKQGEAAHSATRAAAAAAQATSQEDIKRLQAAIDATRTQLQGSQDMTAQAQRDLEEVRKQLAGRPTPEQLAQAVQALEKTAQELTAAQAGMSKLQQENSSLAAALAELKKAQEQLQNAYDAAARERVMLQTELGKRLSEEDVQKLRDKMQQAHEAATAEITALKQRLAQVDAKSAAELKRLQDELAKAQQKAAGLQEGYSRLSDSIKQLEAARAQAEAEAHQAQEELKKAPTKALLTNLEQDLKNARELSATAKQALQQQVAQLQQEIATVKDKAKSDALTAQRAHEDALKKCREDLEALQKDVNLYKVSQDVWLRSKNDSIVSDVVDYNKKANRMESDAKQQRLAMIEEKAKNLEDLLAHSFGVVDKATVDAIKTTVSGVAKMRGA